MAEAARACPGGEGDEGRLAIVATGTLTDVALFCATYPDLLRDKVSQIVLMGGAEGRGNRSPTGEFNIICDPEAAAIVFNAEVPVVMVPLNITHTNLFTPADNERLLAAEVGSLKKSKTPLRWTLSTLLLFFADACEYGSIEICAWTDLDALPPQTLEYLASTPVHQSTIRCVSLGFHILNSSRARDIAWTSSCQDSTRRARPSSTSGTTKLLS